MLISNFKYIKKLLCFCNVSVVQMLCYFMSLDCGRKMGNLEKLLPNTARRCKLQELQNLWLFCEAAAITTVSPASLTNTHEYICMYIHLHSYIFLSKLCREERVRSDRNENCKLRTCWRVCVRPACDESSFPLGGLRSLLMEGHPPPLQIGLMLWLEWGEQRRAELSVGLL